MSCLFSSSFARCKFRKNNNKGSRYTTRDDLDAKNKKGITKEATKPVYNRDMKNVRPYDNKTSGRMRVKVVMTKEEAMALLSKCDRGGTLSFKNAATELAKIPANRISLVHPSSPHYHEAIMLESILESIPEES